MFLSFRWLLSLSVTDSPALALLVAGHIFHVADVFPEFIYPWFIFATVAQEKPGIVEHIKDSVHFSNLNNHISIK